MWILQPPSDLVVQRTSKFNGTNPVSIMFHDFSKNTENCCSLVSGRAYLRPCIIGVPQNALANVPLLAHNDCRSNAAARHRLLSTEACHGSSITDFEMRFTQAVRNEQVSWFVLLCDVGSLYCIFIRLYHYDGNIIRSGLTGREGANVVQEALNSS